MRVSIDNFNVIEKYLVHWGDMDAANHVNNLIYLKWAESARVAYCEKADINLSFHRGTIGPILAWQDCKYIFPMTYPDTAIIGVRASEVQEDRIFIESAIFSEKHQRIVALSKQSIIPYDYGQLRKAPIPAIWIKSIEEIEGVAFN